MSVNATSFKYQELKEYFIRCIRSGELVYNARVPSEPELAKRYKLSRNTIRQAMKELENEGYLYRVRGKGTFVKTKNPEISKKIALVIFDTEYSTHPLVAGMIRGLDAVLSEHGYMLDILASRRTGLEADIMKLANNYAGFIIGAWQIDKNIVKTLMQKRIPHLFVKNYFPGLKENSVLIDFERAGNMIVEHLAELEHKNVALLYAGEKINISHDFKAGVMTACLDNGIKMRQENTIDIGFTSDKVSNAVDFLVASTDRVSAIITLDDDIAATVIQQLRAKGLKVPEDISVTGCNDMPIASLLSPTLTTVSVPINELGREAAEILLKRLSGELKDFKGIKLEPEIIIRESTGQKKTIKTEVLIKSQHKMNTKIV
jgi:GntR family transcriptional regulator, arabinose operon transcriptional repressor